ncbi:MAG: hypothetical protein BWY71_00784 [Planctomycetes bacterium ADurb.Bin412]|nr:MAG: hypothetical protein BWY71_00784 [Planctomycetes bacterium ADurb.Bin412]
MVGPFPFLGGDSSFADPHSAGAQVMQIAMFEAAVATAPAKPDAVTADMGNLAIRQHHVMGAIQHHRRLYQESRLERLIALRRQSITGMLKTQAPDSQEFHQLTGGGVALKQQEFFRQRGIDLRVGHIFTGQRLVIKRSIPVQKPFAGSVQCRPIILQMIHGIALPGRIRLLWFA